MATLKDVKFLQGSYSKITTAATNNSNAVLVSTDKAVAALGGNLFYGQPTLEYANGQITLRGVSGDTTSAELGKITITDLTKDKFLESASYVVLTKEDGKFYEGETEVTQTGLTAGDTLKLVFKTTESGKNDETETVYVPLANLINNEELLNKIAELNAEITSTDGTNVSVKVTEVDGKITAVNVTDSYASVTRSGTTSTSGTPNESAALDVANGSKLAIGSDIEKVAQYAADKVTEEKHRVDKKIADLGGDVTSDDASVVSVEVKTVAGQVNDVIVTTKSAGVNREGDAAGTRVLSASSNTGAVTGADIATIKGYVDDVVSDSTSSLSVVAAGDDYITASVDASNNKQINVSADVQKLTYTNGNGSTDSTLTGTEKSLVDGADVALKVSSFVNARIGEEIAKLDATESGETKDSFIKVTVDEVDGVLTAVTVEDTVVEVSAATSENKGLAEASDVKAYVDAAAAKATSKVAEKTDGHVTVSTSTDETDGSVTYTISENDIQSESAYTEDKKTFVTAATVNGVNATATTSASGASLAVTIEGKDIAVGNDIVSGENTTFIESTETLDAALQSIVDEVLANEEVASEAISALASAAGVKKEDGKIGYNQHSDDSIIGGAINLDAADVALANAIRDLQATAGALEGENAIEVTKQAGEATKVSLKLNTANTTSVTETTGGIQLTNDTNGLGATLYWGSF